MSIPLGLGIVLGVIIFVLFGLLEGYRNYLDNRGQ